PRPTVFNVTGGGSYCTGGIGVPVGLDATESNSISYQLWINGTNSGQSVPGKNNGGSISFGNQTTAGTYTVVAVGSNGCLSTMNGSVTITVTPNNTVSA